MRTTVDLPAELMRAAKARAAARGESLKTLFERAMVHELGSQRPEDPPRTFPLIRSRRKDVDFTSEEIDKILAADDAGQHAP